MRRVAFWALASFTAGVIGLCAPASAQMGPEARVGSRIPHKPETASREFTQDTVRGFAECVAKRQPKLAREFVLDRTSLQFAGRYYALADSYCLSLEADPYYDEVGLKTSGDSLRFGLAEALLQPELPGINPANIANAAPLVVPVLDDRNYQREAGRKYTSEELKDLDDHRRRDLLTLVFYRFGECVARADPQGSRTFLVAKPESQAAGAAVQALMPALGSCVAKGAQFKLDQTVLRGALSVAYYNLAHAPNAVVAAVGH